MSATCQNVCKIKPCTPPFVVLELVITVVLTIALGEIVGILIWSNKIDLFCDIFSKPIVMFLAYVLEARSVYGTVIFLPHSTEEFISSLSFL